MTVKEADKYVFKRGDKVTHKYSEDEEMIGTVLSVNGDNCVVSFFIPGRKKGGYMTEVEFPTSELEPCFIDLEAIKRKGE